MTKIKIENDQQALELLENLLGNPSFEVPEIEFAGWPKFEMHVSGERYHATITPELMEAFLDFQKTINKAYALARYADSSKRLTNAEREDLKILVRVEEGTSGFLASLEEHADKIAGAFVDGIKDMDSRHKLIAFLGLGALVLSGFAVNEYVSYKKEVRLAEIEKIENEAERNERVRTLELYKEMDSSHTQQSEKLLNTLVERMPELLTISQHIGSTYDKFVSSTTDADYITVQGTKIPGPVVEEISHTPRNTSVDDKIASVFRIQNVDHSFSSEYRFKLYDVIRRQEFYATLPKDGKMITDQILDVIQDAEWGRKVVLLQLATKTRSGKVVKAEIEKVTQITDQEPYEAVQSE